MKKFILFAAIAAVSAAPLHAQLSQGDAIVDLGIGVGCAETAGESKAMFTQRLGAEWIVKDNLFSLGSCDFSLGVGFQIDNAVGARYSGLITGSYDYTYSYTIRKETTNHNRPSWTTETHTGSRKGTGMATTDVTRDNIDFMPTVSLHGSIIPKLDLYATFGLGFGVMTNSTSNYEATEVYVPGVGLVGGFESKDYTKESTVNGKIWKWSGGYNDIDHAEWNRKPYKSKAVFACSFHIGARYFINDNWAVNAQFGLVGADVNSTYGNSYNILSVGASYKF